MADAPATTPKPIKKWAYPFKGKGDAAATPPKPVEVTDPQSYFAALAAAADGFYPVGANGLWHGGIHFDGLTAGALDQDAGVRCIADGEVIAYRIDTAYPNVEYPSGGKATYSKGFVLVKHRLQLPPKPKAAADNTATPAKSDATPAAEEPVLTFFSLYMHLLDWAGYAAKKDLARPAFWADATKFIVSKKAVDADPYTQPAPAGKGINVRQAGKGSAVRVGWLPPGTTLTIEAGRGDWRKIVSIDSGQMAADPTNIAAVDAPLGWVYTKELNPAPAEPKAKDTIVVLDTPIATDAGALLGYLGQYGRYADRSALAVARPLVHVEVFSGEDVQGFIDKSKARGKELDDKQKTLLVVDKDSTLVLPTEADQNVAAGVDVKLTDDSPKAGQWAKVKSLVSTPAPTKKNPKAVKLTPTGEAMWVERTLLDDKGQRVSTSLALKAWSQFPLQAANATGPTAHYLRVAAIKTLKTTAADDKSVRWWEIDVDTPDAKGNTRGWACETGHLQSPWEWPGFEIISETATLTDLHGKQLTDERVESTEDKDDLKAKAERAKEGELFQKLYDVIDVDKDESLTTDELRAALKKPWLAQTISRVIARYESEWGGEMNKWDALDGHMGESVDDWAKEKGRIKHLQWWNELKGKHGFPGSAKAFHFHPVGLISNFAEGKKSCGEKFKTVSPIILFNEGGFVNDPDDAGGATNKGIAWNTWQSYAKSDLGLEPTLENLKNITAAQAEVIYRKRYWEPRGFCDIENEKTGLMIYDWTITSGKAIREVQEVLVDSFGKSITINNAMGKTTIDAINEIEDQEDLVAKIAVSRKAYYTSLTYKSDGTKNSNDKFLVGWHARVDRCLRMSL